MTKNVLLLTATINPSAGVRALARRDPDERRADYEKALRYYVTLLDECFDGIVLCENSGADLGSLRAIADESKRPEAVELISFKAGESPHDRERAVTEMLLIEHAARNSEILRRTPEKIVWKCTGRYIIRNMKKLLSDQPKSFDVYCHQRNHPQRACELYMLAWTDKGYKFAIEGVAPKLVNQANQAYGPEALFRLHLDSLVDQIKVVPRFRHVPLIEARRGWNNQPFSNRLWHGKILTRAIALRLAPWLWI